MIKQPAAQVTIQDMENVVRRDYPEDKRPFVMDILNEYGQEKYHREIIRVRMAVLKLSASDLGKLRHYMDVAKGDYRDVFSLAEYPNYSDELKIHGFNFKDKEKIIDKDWKQYCDWLKK